MGIEAHGFRIMSFAQKTDEDRRLKLHVILAYNLLRGDGYDECNVLKSNNLAFWHRHASTVSGQGLGLLVWAQTYEDHCAHTNKYSHKCSTAIHQPSPPALHLLPHQTQSPNSFMFVLQQGVINPSIYKSCTAIYAHCLIKVGRRNWSE